MPSPPHAHVLVAEDDGPMRELIASSLRDAGFSVEIVRDGFELRDRLGAGEERAPARMPAALVSDIRMPGWTGLNALSFLAQHHPEVHVILTTAFGDPRTHARAERLGAAAVFDKPFDLGCLSRALRSLVA